MIDEVVVVTITEAVEEVEVVAIEEIATTIIRAEQDTPSISLTVGFRIF
jgi:hypothetical protein